MELLVVLVVLVLVVRRPNSGMRRDWRKKCQDSCAEPCRDHVSNVLHLSLRPPSFFYWTPLRSSNFLCAFKSQALNSHCHSYTPPPVTTSPLPSLNTHRHRRNDHLQGIHRSSPLVHT